MDPYALVMRTLIIPSLAKSDPWYDFLRPQAPGGNLRFPWLAACAASSSWAPDNSQAPGIFILRMSIKFRLFK